MSTACSVCTTTTAGLFHFRIYNRTSPRDGVYNSFHFHNVTCFWENYDFELRELWWWKVSVCNRMELDPSESSLNAYLTACLEINKKHCHLFSFLFYFVRESSARVILNACRWSNKQLVCRRSWMEESRAAH